MRAWRRDCSKKPVETESVQYQATSSKDVSGGPTQQGIAKNIAVPLVNPWYREGRGNTVWQREKPWISEWAGGERDETDGRGGGSTGRRQESGFRRMRWRKEGGSCDGKQSELKGLVIQIVSNITDRFANALEKKCICKNSKAT